MRRFKRAWDQWWLEFETWTPGRKAIWVGAVVVVLVVVVLFFP